jgi:hypothetical protein
MKYLSAKEAKHARFNAVTTAYRLPEEQWMVNNVLNDMKHGNIDTRLVKTHEGIEVWRKSNKNK